MTLPKTIKEAQTLGYAVISETTTKGFPEHGSTEGVLRLGVRRTLNFQELKSLAAKAETVEGKLFISVPSDVQFTSDDLLRLGRELPSNFAFRDAKPESNLPDICIPYTATYNIGTPRTATLSDRF